MTEVARRSGPWGLTRRQESEALHSILDVITDEMAEGSAATIAGFGPCPSSLTNPLCVAALVGIALAIAYRVDVLGLFRLVPWTPWIGYTITGTFDVMEKKGLVTREPNPDDRRSLLARLTAEGRALQDSAPGLDKTFGSCCVGLEPDEFQQLGWLLSKLNNSLSP